MMHYLRLLHLLHQRCLPAPLLVLQATELPRPMLLDAQPQLAHSSLLGLLRQSPGSWHYCLLWLGRLELLQQCWLQVLGMGLLSPLLWHRCLLSWLLLPCRCCLLVPCAPAPVWHHCLPWLGWLLLLCCCWLWVPRVRCCLWGGAPAMQAELLMLLLVLFALAQQSPLGWQCQALR